MSGSDSLIVAAQKSFSHTVSVFWGAPEDPPGFNSASGILLALDRPLLVTAAHVLNCYTERQAADPTLRFSIGRASLVLGEHRVRGVAEGLDLATIDLSGVRVDALAPHLSFYQPARWPPRRVDESDFVLVSGFPKAYRHLVMGEQQIQFNSCHINAHVDSVAEHRFSCALDMASRHRVYGDAESEWPDDYGAFSGCPAFTYNADSVEFVGIVYEGNEAFHILNVYHADLIASDGTLMGGR
jgi:hypothetical protein